MNGEEDAMMDGPAPANPKADKRLIIALVIAAVVVIALIIYIPIYLQQQFGLIEIPGLGEEEPMQMLVIGQPSVDLLADLDNQRDLVYYRVRNASDLDAAPQDTLAQYDVVLLDQHLGVNPHEKSISRVLGEAVENYVKAGGKLVVVMDSGIYRSGGIYGTGVATDVIGWKPTFGELMPVECDLGLNGVPTCKTPLPTTGKIHRLDFGHKIMEGIEVAPADPRYGPLSLITFDVKPTGSQVAYIKHATLASNYPAIVEKKFLVGKVLYFNYDPAITPGIWQNTLEYLK